MLALNDVHDVKCTAIPVSNGTDVDAVQRLAIFSMGRRLMAGHRLLEPVVGVRILPPQYRERGAGIRKQRIKSSLLPPAPKSSAPCLIREQETGNRVQGVWRHGSQASQSKPINHSSRRFDGTRHKGFRWKCQSISR